MTASGTSLDIWNRALARIGASRLGSELDDRPEAELYSLSYDNLLLEVLEARRWKWAMRQRPLSQMDSQTKDWPGDDATITFQIPFAFLDSTQLTVSHVVSGVATVLTPTTQYTISVSTVKGVPSSVTLIGLTPATGEQLRITVAVSREGWDHLYGMPTDCVTPVALLGEDERYELLAVDERNEWAKLIDDSGENYMLACNLDTTDFEVLEYVAYITHVRAFPALFQNALVWRCAAELAFQSPKKTATGAAFMKFYEEALGDAFAKSANTGQSAKPPTTPSLAARGVRRS